MNSSIKGLLYLVLFLWTSFNLVYNFAYVNFPEETFLTFQGYPGKLKYMTIWNYAFDCFYLGLVAYYFLVKRTDQLKQFLDLLHASLFFPLGLLVCTLFWGMTAVDPESVVDAAIKKIQPAWNNHAMHSVPFLVAILDAVLVKHEYPSNKTGLSVVFAFVLAYLSTVLYLGLGPAHVWAYPVLEKLSRNASELAIFLAVCCFMFLCEYFAGKALTVVVWGSGDRRAALHQD